MFVKQWLNFVQLILLTNLLIIIEMNKFQEQLKPISSDVISHKSVLVNLFL